MHPLALLLAVTANASDRFTVGPAPDWVEEVPIDLAWTGPSGEDGVSWLLVDNQTRRSGGRIVAFSRGARRITSTEGLDAASQVTLSWDPSWQDLRIDAIRLHRDGQVLDRLDPARIQTLRRETGLEDRLYDGALSAVLVLDDLRVGDVLEVASTRTGANPVFDGVYGDAFGAAWSVPIHRFHERLVWPQDRALRVRSLAGAPAPVITVHDGVIEHVWDLRDPAPIPEEDLVPLGFTAYGRVQLSEDASWNDVARWASELHRLPELGPALRAQVAEWAAATDDEEERIDLALDFVQREVRYVGIEIGEGTHRPAPPDVVFERRFGDCKDQTTLLVAALRALGLEAWPALVNTGAGASIDGWLPSRHAFDHVIAAVMLDGRMLFLDPTKGPQGDPPSRRPSPPWRRALVVRPETTGLTEIPRPTLDEPTAATDERWALSSTDGSATVRIETAYRGARADGMRRELATTSAEELSRRYLNYYEGLYPGIEADGPVVSSDDPERNVVTTVETYHLADAWTRPDGTRSDALLLVAGTAREGLRVPEIKRRSFPLAVRYPVFLRHDLHVTREGGFRIPADETRIERPELVLERDTDASGDKLHVSWEVRTLDDAVAAADVPAHLDAVDRAWDATSFRVTRGRTAVRPAPSLLCALWPLVLMGISLAVAVRLARWAEEEPGPAVPAVEVPPPSLPPPAEGELAVVVEPDEAEVRRTARRLARAQALFLPVAITIGGVAGAHGALAIVVTLIAAAAVYGLAVTILTAGLMPRLLRARGPFRVDLAPGGILWRGLDGQWTARWSAVRWSADADGVEIVVGPASAWKLPTTAFATADDAARFRAAAEAFREADPLPALAPLALPGGTTRAVEFVLDREDHLAAALGPRRWFGAAVPVVLALVGAVAGLVAVVRGEPASVAPLALGCAALLGWHLFKRVRAGRAVDAVRREWPQLRLPLRLAIGPEGVEHGSASGTGTIPWSGVARIVEDARRIYLYVPIGGFVLPKRAMADPAGFVAELRRLHAAATRR